MIGGATQTTDLLAACPRLTLLGHSRAPLRVSGRARTGRATPGDARPAAQDEPGAQLVESLSESESVSLFIERAQAVKTDFSLTPENTRTIVEICRRLDGLPLAIELQRHAYGFWIRGRYLDGWSIGCSFSLAVRATCRRANAHCATPLAGAMDSSSPRNEHSFRRLSVFVGGCDLEAAQAVCADDDDVLDGIDSLVANSLLQSVAVTQGDVRISMLETIREFGLEQLAFAGELETLRWRHAEYFLQLAERAEPELWTSTARPMGAPSRSGPRQFPRCSGVVPGRQFQDACRNGTSNGWRTVPILVDPQLLRRRAALVGSGC